MKFILHRRAALILVTAMCLWRAYLAATLQLHPDEAYYWLWTRHLAAGYFDHAPLLAYLVSLTTLPGQGEFWVRLGGVLLVPGLSWMLWRLALQVYESEAVAAGAVMLLNVAPLSVLGLLVTSPDVPSVFFWALGVMVLWALVRTQQTRLWYVLGVVFGLGLLSKYTVVLFGPCVLLFLLLTPERRWLRTPHPYLAVLLGLLLFTPVIYWNSQHDWISFRFQINHGLNPEAGSWNHIAAYVGGQVGVAGPITWLLGLWGTAAALLRRDKGSLLLVCMSLPVIAFFGITSWRTEAGPNWPALGYFTYFLLAASVLRAHSWQRATAWVLSLTTAAALSLIITVHARYTVLPDSVMSPAAREADATNWFHGWRELGQNLLARGAPVPIIAASHQLAAEIIYYTGEAWPVTVDPQARINQFNLWPSPTRPGQTADYIWVEGGAQSDVSAYFSAVQRESSLWVYRAGRVMRTYRIAEGTLRDTAAAKP